MQRVDRGHQLELGVVEHRPAHRGAHAPAGAEDPHPDHRLQRIGGAGLRVEVFRRRRARRPGRRPPACASPAPSTRSMTRATSSAVTASTCSTTPSRLGISPIVSSLRPMRCMRLDELSSDSASDPVRCPLAPTELPLGDAAVGDEPVELAAHDVERLVDPLGRGAAVDRERAGLLERAAVREHRVRQARASRAPPGRAASSCRRRAPGRGRRARSDRGRRAGARGRRARRATAPTGARRGRTGRRRRRRRHRPGPAAGARRSAGRRRHASRPRRGRRCPPPRPRRCRAGSASAWYAAIWSRVDRARCVSWRPGDLTAERVTGEQRAGEQVVHEVVGRVVAHPDLLEDHLALRLDLVGAQRGRPHDVGEDVERERRGWRSGTRT